MKLQSLFLVLLMGMVLIGADLSRERVMTLPAEGITELNIDCGAGSLKVTGEKGAREIRVKATFVSEDIPQDELKAFVEKHVDLKLEKKGDRAFLVSKVNHSASVMSSLFGKRANLRIDLEVTVPAALDLEVDDGSGWIEIRAVNGKVEIDDGSGSITLENIGGAVEIEDGSGGVVLTDIEGDVEIEDGSGDLEVRQVRGDVSIDDGSGEIKVNQVGGSVEISDGSGDIVIDDVKKDVIIRESGSGGVKITHVEGQVIRNDE